MNNHQHLYRLIQLLMLVVFFVAGGVATSMLDVDVTWRGATQSREAPPTISPSKQPTIYPTLASNSDGYEQGSVKSAASEQIYIQPTIASYIPPVVVLPSAQAPAAQTQTVYIGYLSLTTQCLAEGVDAVKTADSTVLDSFSDSKKCVEDRKKDAEDCIIWCNIVYLTEESKWASCQEKCVDTGKQNLERCVAMSRQQADSLNSLVSTYCNK